MTVTDTVFALATPPGRGGVAIFRISGPGAKRVLGELGADRCEPRKAHRARFRHRGKMLDDGLALFFPGPASFTGEDVVELHVHGGRAVCDAIAAALLAEGLRIAEPGEFTRRAFYNGKLDLLAAEAISDLVAAETEAQRVLALEQAGGRLSALYDGWRGQLIRLMAHLEATIDFSDQDIPSDLIESVGRATDLLIADLDRHLEDGNRGERLREGIRIAILGAPNSGKSTLMNRIVGREAAIVSPQAGTTRDVITVALDLGGYPVLLSDTAGIRETIEAVEAEGIRRSWMEARDADLVLEVLDATDPRPVGPLDPLKCIRILNKSDLLSDSPVPTQAVAVSALSGTNIGGLVALLVSRITLLYRERQGPSLTRPRHRNLLESAVSSLRRAQLQPDLVLKAEDLRLAARDLGRITGALDVEDLLDVIFKDFCIGK